MDRRTALKVLGIATMGALAGRVVYAEVITETTNWLKKPTRILWDLNDIEVIEIRKGGETIEIKTQEIFEALKKL